MYYRECIYCGASLDPGERCDCSGASASYRVNLGRFPAIKKCPATMQNISKGIFKNP